MMLRFFAKALMCLLIAAMPMCLADQAEAVSVYDDAVVYYPFEGTGTTVLDASLTTTSIDLTINGTYTREPEGCAGSALTLDNESYVTSGTDVDALDLGRDNPITVASWIKVDGMSDRLAIASKMESSDNYRGWWFYRTTAGTIDFLLRSENNDTSRLWVKSLDPANYSGYVGQNEWAHVAVTYSYDENDALYGVKLFLNGQELPAEIHEADSMLTSLPTDNTVPFNIGGRNDTGKGYGSLDELAVWNRALTPTEIESVYNLGDPPVQERPTGNYLANGDFEDTTGWGMAGTTAVPAGWAVENDRKNAATQVTGTSGIDGTSAYMEPFVTSEETLRREIRQDLELATLSNWQFDVDFASGMIFGATDRSLALTLHNEEERALSLRVADSDENGVGDLQVYNRTGSGWEDIPELMNKIQFDTSLSTDPLTHHLTIIGHYEDETPNYDIILTDSNDNEYTVAGMTTWFYSAPSSGTGISNVEFNTFNSMYAYLIDNVSLIDLAVEEWIPGDANKDGFVDGSDATILANYWQYGVGNPDPDATWEMGDFNGDHVVDGSDATLLASHWQEGTPPPAAVPEPSTVIGLIALLLAGLALSRRNR